MTSGNKPYWSIMADSVDITTKLSACMLSIKVTDVESEDSDAVEIMVGDPFDVIEFPKAGAELMITMGYDGRGTNMGRYVVDEAEVSGPPTHIRIKASSAPFAATGSRYPSLATQKRRSWDAVTIGAIVKKIASEHNLIPLVSPSLETTVILHDDQADKSDIHYLNALAKQNTAIVKVADGKLVFAKAGEARFLLDGVSLPNFTIPKNRTTSYGLTSSQRLKWTSVIASYRDTLLSRDIDVIYPPQGGLPQARIPHVFPNAATALRAAASRLSFIQRASDVLHLELPGDPNLGAEGMIILSELDGWRPEFAGSWTMTNVEHTIDGRGYRTSVDAMLPPY